MTRGTNNTAGFTLIEVLVALVVASLILTVVMNAALVVRDRQRSAERREEAVLAAAAMIAEQSARPPASSLTRGKQGNLSWELEEHAVAEDPVGFFVLSQIEARLFDRNGKLIYKVATRKLKELPLQ